MEQKTSLAKSVSHFGILFGAIMVLEFIIGYAFNIDPQTNKTYGVIINVLNYLILPFLFIYLASNHYKKNINNGFISFGQCIKVGLTVAFIASIVYGVFYIIFVLIFPEFIPELIEKIISITRQQNPNMSEEQMEMSISIIKKMMSPYITFPIVIVMNCFIALIHSLIVGAIVKKDPINSI